MSKQFFLAAALAAALSATAQDTAHKRLDEVLVTASKFPNKTALTGKVVTVITQQDLERAGARDLSQIITEQGGVYLNGAFSNGGKDKSVFLRGAKVEHTLITIDGVPVYDASGIGSNFDIRLIPIESVQRIEILRGSQSTLYGSDAIAGVINIITKKSGTKPIGASGSVSYGSFNTVRAAAGVHGVLKKLDYNIGYNHFNTDGISEAQKPDTVAAAYDKDGFTQNGVQASLGIQAAKGVRIQPYLRYTKNGGGYDQQQFADAAYTYTQKNLQTGVRNEAALGTAKLTVLYNYTRTVRDHRSWDTAAYKGGEHFGEAYVVYPLGAAVTLTGGVDLRHSHTSYQSSAPFMQPIGRDSARQTQAAAYGAFNIHTTGGFGLEAGVRYNHHSTYGGNAAFNLNPSHLFNRQWKAFANLSSGYKTPSLYQLYSEYGNRALKPENALNAEGGLQYFLPNEKGAIRATFFYRNVRDVIAFFYNPGLQRFQYINQDKQRDHGVELDSKISLTDALDLKLFYSYVDGKTTTKSNGKDTTYFNLLRRPKSSAAATVGYHFFKSAYVSLQVSAFGKRSDVFYDPVTFARQDITLDAYTLVNVYAEYGVLKKLKLFADLRNILDATYNEIYGYSTPRFNGYGGLRVQL